MPTNTRLNLNYLRMDEGFDKKDGNGRNDREEIFSKAVRAGKRTYFFDVKATRRNDYYLTLTESKKRFGRDGQPYFEKHKIFLYKEDFEKFSEGLAEVIEFIKEANPVLLEKAPEETGTDSQKTKDSISKGYTSVEFEDLEEKKD